MAETSALKRSRSLRLLKWLSLAFAAAVLLCFLSVCLLLGTESGRLFAANKAISIANSSETLRISLEGLTASELGQIEFSQLEVRKYAELWIRVENLSLSWQPREVLRKKLHVNELNIVSADVYKLTNQPPISENESADADTEAETDSANIDLEELQLPRFALNRFLIQQLRFVSDTGSEALFDTPSIRLTGSTQLDQEQPFAANIDAELRHPKQSEPSRLALTVSETDGQIRILGTINEQANGWVGGKIKLPPTEPLDANIGALIAWEQGRFQMRIEEFSAPLAGRAIAAYGEIQTSSDFQQILIPEIQLSIDQSLHRASGRLEPQALDIDIQLDEFPLDLLTDLGLIQIDQIPLDEARLSVSLGLSGPLESPRFDASVLLSAELASSPFDLTMIGQGDISAIEVSRLDASWGQAAVTAQGELDLAGDASVFDFTLTDFDFARLEGFGVELPESLDATVSQIEGQLLGNIKDPDAKLSGQIAGGFYSQDLDLSFAAEKTGPELDVERLILTIGDAETSLNGRLNLDQLDGQFALVTDPLSIELTESFGVQLPAGLTGYLQGDALLSGSMRNPDVTANLRIDGDYNEIPYSALANVKRAEDSLEVQALTIQAQERDVLNIRGRITPAKADLQLTANRLPTEILAAAGVDIAPGRFSADFTLVGDITAPLVDGFMEYEVTPHTGANRQLFSGEDFSLRLDAETSTSGDSGLVDNYRFRSNFVRDGVPSGQLSIQIPAESYIGFARSQNGQGSAALPLDVDIIGGFDLGLLSLFADADIHRLSGLLEADLSVGGTLSAPEFIGSAAFQNTRYENPLTGTRIDALDCLLIAKGQRFEIDQCSATDGEEGALELEGSLRLPLGESDGDIQIQMDVQQARVLQRPEIESQASGSIRLAGDFKSLLAQGTIEVAPLEASIEATSSSGIPKIKVERVASLAEYDIEGLVLAEPTPLIELDLLVTASQQAYIRGRGLEAELQGEIYLRGTTSKPRYEGEFSTIRGEFEVFGKKFELENGLVNFANDAVGLNFEGVYEEDGQNITALITGTAENLDIRFTANPSMAEDEILAFIIFGKSVQEITPFEAIQLAAAVQQLRGGGGFDPIGEARDALGVDRLRIETETREDDSTGINVGIGKYLNEKVYLELERTPNPSQPWKGNLEIELAPNLILESSTGGTTGIEGAELKWKRDY